jgi:SpoVK/Ycf46/Vps4 family AAA+-type ATPase
MISIILLAVIFYLLVYAVNRLFRRSPAAQKVGSRPVILKTQDGIVVGDSCKHISDVAEFNRQIASRGLIILNDKRDPEELKRIVAAERHQMTLLRIEAELDAERWEAERLKAQRIEEDRLEAEQAKEAQRQAELARHEEGSWDQLVLPHETKEKLKTYCEILSNHAWYTGQGINPPRGLVFYGPPGCGKTETARFLSKKAGFSFVSLSSADLKVGWIGRAAVAIQKAFADARAKAPCIVYEIDASCPTRMSGQNSVIDNEVEDSVGR